MSVRFSFTAMDGQEFVGHSYTTGRASAPPEGTQVDVVYKVSDPRVARIPGMRYKAFGSFVAFVFIFPLVGLALVLPTLLAGSRRVQLLRIGEIKHGTPVPKRTTGTVVNRERVMALTFRFELGASPGTQTAPGHTPGRATGTSYLPLGASSTGTFHVEHCAVRTASVEDEAWEPILYDPTDPTNAALVDGLDGMHIDDVGRIVAHPSAWLYLLGPIGVVLMNCLGSMIVI